MPPSRTTTSRPCDSSTAWNARSHGWFLISALTLPFNSFERMMVRPLKAANPATTSRRSALSQVTVMRAACDCALSRACSARYSSIETVPSLGAGVTTRAAWPAPPRDGAGVLQVDHEPGGTGEREVLPVYRPLEVDHHPHAAGRRPHADGPDFAVSPPPRKGSGCRRDAQPRGEGCDALHGVTSCLASCRLSCRSNPNSCTVNTISRGRIVVTLRRPRISPVFARYTLLFVTSRSTATLRAG